MPPLVSHLILADRAADEVASDLLHGANGDFLLGATTPDIRVLTHWDRDQTHFFRLDEEGHQDSVCAFFTEHPQLRDAARLDPATRAWVCGYLTHLILDQEYILNVYRPHFGRRSLLGGDGRANLLDRVLQYEVDRREREDQAKMRELRQALFASAVEIDAGFIDRETLEQWRDATAAVTEHPPDWERFAFIASRHLQHAGIDSAGGLRQFMEQVPEMLDECRRQVDQAQLDAFFESVREQTAAQLRDYLAAS